MREVTPEAASGLPSGGGGEVTPLGAPCQGVQTECLIGVGAVASGLVAWMGPIP